MDKLNMETFINFTKDKESNTDGFESWGLFPNEEPQNPTSGSGAKNANKKSTGKSANTGAYNY